MLTGVGGIVSSGPSGPWCPFLDAFCRPIARKGDEGDSRPSWGVELRRALKPPLVFARSPQSTLRRSKYPAGSIGKPMAKSKSADAHAEPKQLSAHQQRYAARKQLKKQVVELKAQHDQVNSLQRSRRGLSKADKLVSKADKFALKKQKRTLSLQIREVALMANDKTLPHKAAPRAAAAAPAAKPAGKAPAAKKAGKAPAPAATAADDAWSTLWAREALALG